jgi:uncharacterized alpha-E superfamily protein
MHRYLERTENTARLIDTGLRVALTGGSEPNDVWNSVLQSAGIDKAFAETRDEVSARSVTDFMLRDTDNPSSVRAAMETARNNGRMVRTALTREVWESLNEAWMNLCNSLVRPISDNRMPEILDLIKRQIAHIRGAFEGTMLRDERFDFARLGTHVERADNTARILDVKYYVLLPGASWVGSALDTHQWESILRSVSAHRSYRWLYDAQYKPTNIADFLILNPRMPRSLAFCYAAIANNLNYLATDYGVRHACHDTADAMLGQLKSARIADVFEQGLHEFLTGFVRENNKLGAEIAESYRFY